MADKTIVILEQIGEMQRNLAELKASLAEKWVRETVPTGTFEMFVCRADAERYGLPVESVEEVLAMCKLGDYPEGPPWFSGVLNLRGEILPVVDVIGRIENRRRAVRAGDFIVVVNVDGKRFGLVFQEVFHVHTVNGATVQPPMRDIPEALYVLGIVNTKEAPVYLLSLSALLGTADIPEELL